MKIIINDKTCYEAEDKNKNHISLFRQEKKIRSVKKNNRDKLYESIAEDIMKMYGNTLSKTEAHSAARNLIEFYRILLE